MLFDVHKLHVKLYKTVYMCGYFQYLKIFTLVYYTRKKQTEESKSD